MIRYKTHFLLSAFLLLSLFTFWQPAHSLAQTDQQCFAETGYCIQGRILQYWQQNGGLSVFGLPITPQQQETIEGQTLQVQWFERNRLELHPENAAPYDVLSGRLGVDVLTKNGRDWQTAFARSEQQADCRYFAETGHNVCGSLLALWRAQGLELDGVGGKTEAENLALFGLPLSDAHTEVIAGQEYTVQWFERARFELHPENAPPYDVLQGLLGSEMGPAVQQTPTLPTPSVPTDTWQQFTSAEGRFSITMPGIPIEQRQKLDTAVGQVDFILYTLETDAGRVGYMVAFSDFPAGILGQVDSRQVLNTSVENQIRTMGFTSDGWQDVTLNGYPGVEVSASGSVDGHPTKLKGRFYLVGDRLYQAITAGTAEVFVVENADRFLGSFALTS